jgi:NAD(P)H-flavin reductase
MSAVLATRAAAPAAHGAAARRLTAGRSAFARSASPSIARAFAARRASGSRATHVLTTAGWNDFEWGTATVVSNEPAAKEGGLRSVKVSVAQSTAEAYGTPGQFVQMRTTEDGKPAFLAIASPPRSEPAGILELLIKSTEGTAGEICALKEGATVDVSPPMGGGFDLGKAPIAESPNALLFATGSGISPIRALVKSGALDGRSVRLFYGTASSSTCAFLEEFDEWKTTHNIAVTHVQSQVGGPPTYVQDALKDAIADGTVVAAKTCAVLCGQKEMTEAVIAILTEAGVPKEKCIMNF